MYVFRFLGILYICLIIFKVIHCNNESTSIHNLKTVLIKNILKLDAISTINSTDPYCHLCCVVILVETIKKHCGSHTLCKYPNDHPGPACKGYIPIKFTKKEKEMILDAHNVLRNNVASGLEKRGTPGPQPSAGNMRVLEWNDELAFMAERWAAQCIYSHDICRDLERFPVGQNLADGNFVTINELSFIKSWYDDVKFFNKSEVDSFTLQDKDTSDKYTQLIWADTYQLGCARAIFQQSLGAEVIYREHFICNYGPRGNIPNQSVYIPALPCSACQEGTSCSLDYSALCERGFEKKRNKQIEREELSMKTAQDLKNRQVMHNGQGLLYAYFTLLFNFMIVYILYF